MPPIIAQRVADSRPYYTLDDLLAVRGFSRGRLLLLKQQSNAFCATPITVDELAPAVPASACVAGQIDAATADLGALTARSGLGLPLPVARWLIVRRSVHPFPTLASLKAIPAISEGRLRVWARTNRACLTPAPFVATSPDSHLYKAALVSRTTDQTLELVTPVGRYALGVPAGTLADAHAWATIKPVASDQAPEAPTADFHLHGAWAGTVYMGLPPDHVPGEQPGTWQDSFWHQLSGGVWTLTWGDNNIALVNGSLTVATTTLSLGSLIRVLKSAVSTAVHGFITAAAWAEETTRRLLGIGASQPDCAPDTAAPPRSGWVASDRAERLPGF